MSFHKRATQIKLNFKSNGDKHQWTAFLFWILQKKSFLSGNKMKQPLLESISCVFWLKESGDQTSLMIVSCSKGRIEGLTSCLTEFCCSWMIVMHVEAFSLVQSMSCSGLSQFNRFSVVCVERRKFRKLKKKQAARLWNPTPVLLF